MGYLFAGLAASGRLPSREADLVLRVQAPTAEQTTGAEFPAVVLLDTKLDEVQGWSFGVAHDPAVLEVLGAVMGATTATVNEGNKPDFLVISTAPKEGFGVTMAAVISFTLPITLSAGEGYELLKMNYRVIADPTQADPCVPVEGQLEFSSQLGQPPVSTVVTVKGDTKTPTTVDGSVTVRCPGTIEITRCEGDTENVYLEWTFGGTPTWDFLFLYRDGELLASLDPSATSYTDQGLEPGDYSYTLVTFVVEDPQSPVLIFAYCTGTVIPVTLTSIEPAIGNWIGGDMVTVQGTAFTTKDQTTLVFFDADRTLPLEVLEVVSENELRATTPEAPRIGLFNLRIANERGSAELSNAFEYGFVRGDANADGMFNISDGIFILNFLFLGDIGPPCLDAADATDESNVKISDAIRIFSFLFVGGTAPPPAPYPGPGADPTTNDALGCLDQPSEE